MAIRYGNRKILTLQDLELEGKTVFCRVDYNVPLEDNKITDDTRIKATLPTLKFILEAGGRVILGSHLGRPKGKPDPKYSLLPVAERLAELLEQEVLLPDDCIGDGVKKVIRDQKRGGRVVLLENLRYHSEEENNDPKFAALLESSCDLYVTDAFGSLHRAHASTDALPRLFEKKAVGLLVEKELKFLTPLLEGSERPYAVILGGAKVSDKIKVIEKLLTKIDSLYLGGAMVFTFLRAMGRSTGKSLVEENQLVQAQRILDAARAQNVKVYLPEDFQLGKSVDQPGNATYHLGLDIPSGWMGLDIGPKSVGAFARGLSTAKTIFWNGPMGLFEKTPFDKGTLGIAKVLGDLPATRVVGGGDSVAALHQAGVADKMDHVSTGGGATLEFLEGRALPGLESVAV